MRLDATLVSSVARLNPETPRNWSMAVAEGNDPVPHEDEFGPYQPTMAHLY